MNIKNKKISSKKGITLIALIITVIILMILAGVVIGLILGDKGLFSKLNTSPYEESAIAEKRQLDYYIKGEYWNDDNKGNEKDANNKGKSNIEDEPKALSIDDININYDGEYTEEGWTNQNVIIKVTLKEPQNTTLGEQGYILYIGNEDDTEKITTPASEGITVSANENVYVVLKDNNGNTSNTYKIAEPNIDTTAPSTLTVSATSQSLTFSAIDEESGITGYSLSTIAGTPSDWTEWDGTSKNITIDNNKKYYLYVKNAANLTKNKSFEFHGHTDACYGYTTHVHNNCGTTTTYTAHKGNETTGGACYTKTGTTQGGEGFYKVTMNYTSYTYQYTQTLSTGPTSFYVYASGSKKAVKMYPYSIKATAGSNIYYFTIYSDQGSSTVAGNGISKWENVLGKYYYVKEADKSQPTITVADKWSPSFYTEALTDVYTLSCSAKDEPRGHAVTSYTCNNLPLNSNRALVCAYKNSSNGYFIVYQ